MDKLYRLKRSILERESEEPGLRLLEAAESKFQTAELKFQVAQAVEDAKFQQQANYCRVWTI